MSIKNQTPQPDDGPESKVSNMAKVFACALFLVSSSSITLVNKSLYNKFGFRSPLDLLLVQCLCNLLICSIMMIYKAYDPKAFVFFDSIGMRVSTFREVLPKYRVGFSIGTGNLINVLFGLYSLRVVNIPLFLTFRRCTVLTTNIVNWFLTSTIPKYETIQATTLIVSGAFIAGGEKFDSNWFGYFLVWMNNFAQSFYIVLVNKVNKEKKVTPFEINFFFASIGLPISLIITLYTGDIWQLTDILAIEDMTLRLNFLLYIAMSGCLGIIITVSVLMACTLCSPVTFNISANLKDVALTYAGFIFFDDVSMTFLVGFGLAFSFLGAALYIRNNYVQEKKKALKQ